MQATRETLLSALAELQTRSELEARQASLLHSLTEQADDAVRREYDRCTRQLTHLGTLRREYAEAFDTFVQQEADQPTPYGDRVRIAWCELCAVLEKIEQVKKAFQTGESLRLQVYQTLENVEDIRPLYYNAWPVSTMLQTDQPMNSLLDLLLQYETMLGSAAVDSPLAPPWWQAGSRRFSQLHNPKKFLRSIRKALPASQQALEAQRISLEAEESSLERSLTLLVLSTPEDAVPNSGA